MAYPLGLSHRDSLSSSFLERENNLLKDKFKQQVGLDLIEQWENEAEAKSVKGIDALNKKELKDLNSLPLTFRENRFSVVDQDLAQLLVSSLSLHPVVSSLLTKYEDPSHEVEIGYCFGRATYVHLLLLYLGLEKESVKKLWLVGPMNIENDTWEFHVATAVRSETGNWLVIDNETGLLTAEQWLEHFKKSSEDQKLRLYVSDPEKFTAELTTYSRLELGLDLSNAEDAYSGYFKDLMAWFSSSPDLTKIGLKSLQEIKNQLQILDQKDKIQTKSQRMCSSLFKSE